jgi:hypothetical protein
MKYNLEILSNEKFLINFLFDICLAIKISLKKYWYIFVIIIIASVYGAQLHFQRQSEVYYLRSTFKLGSILTPSFGSNVITLGRVSSVSRYGRNLLLENFGMKKNDMMSSLKQYLGGAGFLKKTSGSSFNYLSTFEYSPQSAFVSISGEGTEKGRLIEKYNELMDFIFNLYESQKNIKNDPLIARWGLILEEKKMIDKEYEDLIEIEKDFGFTSEVEDKKDSLSKRLINIRTQLLDFERSQKKPYLEDIKVIKLSVSNTARKPYGKRIFYLIYLGAGIVLQIIILVLLIVLSFRSIPPNVYFLDIQDEQI